MLICKPPQLILSYWGPINLQQHFWVLTESRKLLSWWHRQWTKDICCWTFCQGKTKTILAAGSVSAAYYTAGLSVQLVWEVNRPQTESRKSETEADQHFVEVKTTSHLTNLWSEEKHFSIYRVKEREREILATKMRKKEFTVPACAHILLFTIHLIFSFIFMLYPGSKFCVHGKTKSLLTNGWSQRQFPLSALARRDIPCSGSAAPWLVSNCQQWFHLEHQGEPKQFGKDDLSQVGPTQILQNTHAEQPEQEKYLKIIRKMNRKNPPDLAEALEASEVA